MVPRWFFVAMLAHMALALEQSPDTVIRQGQSTNLSCSKKKSSSTAMHWYRLPLGKDSRLVLVASALEAGKATIEEDLRSHFKSSEIQGDKITLLIEHAFLNDSGMYYCTESQALQQSPDTVVQVGDSVTLTCSEKENAFASMYWYKLPMGKDATLQLVVYSVEGGMAEIEKEFRNHFQSNGTKSNRLSVEIDHALLNDSGTYFCANQDPQ
ncbi:unnamed protein product [Bubo scandiacus]